MSAERGGGALVKLASATPAPPIPAFTFGERLTPEQLAFLDEYGFIRFRGFADPATLRALREDVEAVDRKLVAEGRTVVNGVPLILGTRPDGTRYVQRMAFA